MWKRIWWPRTNSETERPHPGPSLGIQAYRRDQVVRAESVYERGPRRASEWLRADERVKKAPPQTRAEARDSPGWTSRLPLNAYHSAGLAIPFTWKAGSLMRDRIPVVAVKRPQRSGGSQHRHCFENLRFNTCAPMIRIAPAPAATGSSGIELEGMWLRMSKQSNPAVNIARQDRRRCLFRYAGISVYVPITNELTRNSGSDLSETLINDAIPAKDSSSGPETQWTKQRAAISIPVRSPAFCRWAVERFIMCLFE
jgi:hypothetical protein